MYYSRIASSAICRRGKIIACAIFLGCCMLNSIWADIVVLKHGSILEGIIISEDDEKVVLDADGIKITLRKKDIESITKSEYIPPSSTYKPPQEKPPSDLNPVKPITPTASVTPTSTSGSDLSPDTSGQAGIALSDDDKTPEQIEINNILRKLVDANEKEPWKISPDLIEKGKSDIVYLISLMVSSSNDVNIRRWIIYTLGQIISKSTGDEKSLPTDEKIVNALKGVLPDPDEIIRSAAVEALGHFTEQPLPEGASESLTGKAPKKDILGQIKNLMKSIMETDASISVRFQAINNLAAWYDFSATPSLIKALGNEDGTIRSAASDALVKFINLPEEEQSKYTGTAYDIIPMLLPKLREDSEGLIRKEILAILGKVKDKRAFDVLKQLIRDSDPEIRMLAVVALGSMADKETIEILLDMMENDSDKTTRIQILQVLQTLKREETIPRIIELLKDPDKEIRYSASRALRQITGKALGATYELWKDWWDKLQGIK